MRGAHRGVSCSKVHPLIEAELFAVERCRPAPSGRALTALRITQCKFRALQRPISETTHGIEPPYPPFSRECFAERPAEGQRGVKRGHRKPQVSYVPFCPRRGYGVSAARRRQCTRNAMANIPRPGRAYLASSGAPLYRRKILHLLSVKQKGHSSPAAASRRNGGTAYPLLTVSQAKREPFGSL